MRPAKITYDKSHPWLVFEYPLPDWACWLIGYAIIQSHCLICGGRQRIWKPIWTILGHNELTGPRMLRDLRERHQHPSMVYRPILWNEPCGNHAAWMEWRRHQ